MLKWGLSQAALMETHLDRKLSKGIRPVAGFLQQVERWSRHPGAVGCFHFGHAVGRKPA